MKKPNATIVIPVLNEEHSIGALLDALEDQDFPVVRTEILVVDGGSSDRTRDLVTQAIPRFPRMRLLDNPRRTAAAGLNIGIANAWGDIIIRMDGHSIFAAHHVSRCVELLTTTDAACAGGPIDVRGSTAIGRAQAALTKTWMGTGGALFRCGATKTREADTVFCGAWWRSHFNAIGWFDESLPCNQDDEFHFRTRDRGGRILLDPSLKATWKPRETLRGLMRQYGRYGFHKVHVLRLHPTCRRWRHLIPAIFVATLIALTSLGLGWIAISILAIHILCTAVSVGAQAPLVVAAAPVIALTQHISYGTGFLWACLLSPFKPIRPSSATTGDEVARIRDVFSERDKRTTKESHGQAALDASRWRTFLKHARPFLQQEPGSWDVLEIGCGNGGWLNDFLNEGVAEANLTGVDLCRDRIERARTSLPNANLHVVDGQELPVADASMDVVVLSTVFSSIHSRSMRHRLADEAVRVVRRNGIIVVYDVRLPNPFNADLLPLCATDHYQLFQGHSIKTRQCTLLPPLTRRLAHRWPTVYRTLERVPFLQSHIMAVVQRVPAQAGAPLPCREVAHA